MLWTHIFLLNHTNGFRYSENYNTKAAIRWSRLGLWWDFVTSPFPMSYTWSFTPRLGQYWSPHPASQTSLVAWNTQRDHCWRFHVDLLGCGWCERCVSVQCLQFRLALCGIKGERLTHNYKGCAYPVCALTRKSLLKHARPLWHTCRKAAPFLAFFLAE